jgi:hypothetical protein
MLLAMHFIEGDFWAIKISRLTAPQTRDHSADH